MLIWTLMLIIEFYDSCSFLFRICFLPLQVHDMLQHTFIQKLCVVVLFGLSVPCSCIYAYILVSCNILTVILQMFIHDRNLSGKE